MDSEYDRLESEGTKRENPRQNASIFSILSFWWVREILATGNKRPLENDDLFPLLEEDKTENSTEKIQLTWNEETAKHVPGKKGSGYRLLRALVRMLPWTDYTYLLGMALLFATCRVLQPAFLSLLLLELMKSPGEDFWWAYIYGAGICLSQFGNAIADHQAHFHSVLMSLRWKSATIAIIYKKVLSLSQADLSNLTSGFVINVIASDLRRFELVLANLYMIFQALFELCGTFVLTLYLFGWKTLSGIFFMSTLSLYYGMAGRICATLRSRISKVADQRINVMNSIISGIRAVKMYAWEWPFMKRVLQARRKEIKLIRWKTGILATFHSLYFSCQIIATFITLVTLAANGMELNSYNTFVILSLVTSLRTTMSWTIAQTAKVLADFAAALSRIQDILEYENGNARKYLQDAFTTSGNSNHSDKTTENKERTLPAGKNLAILLQNVVCSWTGNWNKLTLKSMSLSVEKGDMVFITGPVGSGKSSLLYTILREIPLFNGNISCQGKIAWVGQQPWVFCGTVRDNILFGEAFDPHRYRATLQACDLCRDLQRFPDGDLTHVGERGIVLSGGQRARVELARAVYSNADIYLLDDPLSAVDAKVGNHIFQTCISELLRDKTRLMSTHNLQVLRDADHIVVMENGSTLAAGSFTARLHSGSDLRGIDPCAGNKEALISPKLRPLAPDKPTSDTPMLDDNITGLENVEEDRVIGSISWRLYWHYLQAGMCTVVAGAVVVFFLFVQGCLVLPDWWLLTLTNRSRDPQRQTKDFYIYGGLVAGAFLLSVIRAGVCLNALINSSNNLHNSMLAVALKAPVLFFDTNPVGRVLNRFSRDIGIMDEVLPDVFLEAVQLMLFSIGSVILPSVLNPWIILPATPLVAVFVLIGRYYLRSSRDLRRLEGVNRSPVISHFSDTLEGLVTIRAYKREDEFLKSLYRYQDVDNQVWFAIISTARWLATQVDMICITFVTFVVFLAISTHADSGITALSIVYAMQLAVQASQYCVRVCVDIENYMTSVERVITYTQLVQEPGYQNHHQPPENWPKNGQMRVNNLSLVYYQGGPKILKDISFTIDSHEKIGIVGRTGAGKSSLVAALFRMPQATGEIMIDDVNIGDINLQSSRRAMAVITQNPVLFTAPLRMNLDPLEEHDDRELWDALEEASLRSMVEKLPRQLSEEVKECGTNFSVGERQLLCLARALLKKNKIIVMDEATANVDHKTDQLIQETIRTKFQRCTVITIAHRLNTVIDYDRVLVLENGKIVEFDKPEILLQNKGGRFSRLYLCYTDNDENTVKY